MARIGEPQGWGKCIIPPTGTKAIYEGTSIIKSVCFTITKESSFSFWEVLSCSLGRHIVIFCHKLKGPNTSTPTCQPSPRLFLSCYLPWCWYLEAPFTLSQPCCSLQLSSQMGLGTSVLVCSNTRAGWRTVGQRWAGTITLVIARATQNSAPKMSLWERWQGSSLLNCFASLWVHVFFAPTWWQQK